MSAYMLKDYLLEEYGRKLYKISIDAGFSCPNRDGTCGVGGCIFCSGGGSGDFAEQLAQNGFDACIERGKGRIERKFHPSFAGSNYIAYFQAFTGTYAPMEKLTELYEKAVKHPDIAVLSIATRPDCLSDEVISLLKRLNEKKPVWVELGLQTMHDKEAEFLNRCYPTRVYDDAVLRLREAGIKVVTHVILFLPHETKEEMKQTVLHVVKCGSWGIKLQLLHILKGTRLEQIYRDQPFFVPALEEYVEFLGELLSLLPDNMVIHRLTGDAPKKLLIEPKWSADKKRVLNAIAKIKSSH